MKRFVSNYCVASTISCDKTQFLLKSIIRNKGSPTLLRLTTWIEAKDMSSRHVFFYYKDKVHTTIE